MEYTKEPWIVDGEFIRGTDGGQLPNGREYIAKTMTEWLDSPVDRAPANASRIVACVNACVGIETSVLEHGDFPMQLAGILALKMQRDELLSAAKKCRHMLLTEANKIDALFRAETILLEAIAKAEKNAGS